MGAQVLEETVTDNETKVAAKASTVLVEKRDGRLRPHQHHLCGQVCFR